MSTSTATAYEYNVAGHLSFGAPKCEKAQKSSGFWANRTYRLCIKDNVLIDPACGSGNFLTETYISIRRLENEVIRLLFDSDKKQVDGQLVMGNAINPIKVSINQFYGIEINDFAVTVARTALWIAESQMMKETEDIIYTQLEFLPLTTQANIIEGNALKIDWENIISKNKLSYIMGNPPFNGARWMSQKQKNDVIEIFGKEWKGVGDLDYVCCWYKKAVEYINTTNIKTAFVSTNSIS